MSISSFISCVGDQRNHAGIVCCSCSFKQCVCCLQVMGFSEVMVAVFIAVVGILSVCAQVVLGVLMRSLGSKHTIMVGLLFEMLQLMWYGFGSQTWLVVLFCIFSVHLFIYFIALAFFYVVVYKAFVIQWHYAA